MARVRVGQVFVAQVLTVQEARRAGLAYPDMALVRMLRDPENDVGYMIKSYVGDIDDAEVQAAASALPQIPNQALVLVGCGMSPAVSALVLRLD